MSKILVARVWQHNGVYIKTPPWIGIHFLHLLGENHGRHCSADGRALCGMPDGKFCHRRSAEMYFVQV